MSKLKLDEAIKHCLEVAENCEEQAKQCDSDDRWERHVMHENAECAAEHRQLAEWLTELKEAKRLLKAAVEDMTEMQFGEECKVCSKKLLPNECPIQKNVFCEFGKDFKWRYADEAERLLKGE